MGSIRDGGVPRGRVAESSITVQKQGFDKHLPIWAKLWPMLVIFWSIWSEIGEVEQDWPMFVKYWPMLAPTSANTWSTLGQFG